jgi:RimJ/RimL family protein N-acetyltransferase
MPFQIPTARLLLVGGDEAWLEADAAGRTLLAAAAHAQVPENWPPEHHDLQVIEWVRTRLPQLSPEVPWRFYYLLLRQPRTLVGTCGFKGPPDEAGCVELGYSVLEQFQRRGLASEAVTAMIEAAFAAGAREVAAETFPSLLPSIRVMEKCGMTCRGEGSEPGTVRYARGTPAEAGTAATRGVS